MSGLEGRILTLVKDLEEEKRLADKRAKQLYLAGASFIGHDDTPAAYAGQAGKILKVNAVPDALEFVDWIDQAVKIASSPTHATMTLSAIAAGAADYDRFLVSHSGLIKYRTGTQVRSDIGAGTSNLALGATSTTAYRGDRGTLAYNHIAASGSSHTYINQSVTTAASPTFAGLTMTGLIYRSGNQTIQATGRIHLTASNVVAISVYTQTTSVSNDVRVTTAGYLKRYSSSIRYKNKVEDLELDSALIYKLRPVSFCSTSEGDDKKQRHHGFIAEEVERVCPGIIAYGTDRKAEGYSNEALMALMLAEQQRHEARIKELEEKLNNN